MTLKLIECHDLEQHTDSLARFLPDHNQFEAAFINDSNLRNLLKGLSKENLRIEALLKQFQDEYIPDEVSAFLEDWERAYGIPDDCFPGDGDLDDRYTDLIVKIASLGILTVEDFERLGDLFGIPVTVVPGLDAVPLPSTDPKFTIVVLFQSDEGFTYTFPFIFGGQKIVKLRCLFEKLKPANCVLEFREA